MTNPNDPQVSLRIRSFEGQVLYFNGMYKLPLPGKPALSAVVLDEKKKNPDLSAPAALSARITGFYTTLNDELFEGFNIRERLTNDVQVEELDILVDLADWLGDIIVYCMSEGAKYGLPMSEVLRIIMASNFSKLQADGTVKYDANGKVQKGPGYWKPEPLIRDLLEDLRKEQK